MRRRAFIAAVSGAALWPFGARAQQAGKVWRIGVLETISPELNAANFNALRNGLRNLGYIEGQNLIFEYRSAEGRAERFPQLANEFNSCNGGCDRDAGDASGTRCKKRYSDNSGGHGRKRRTPCERCDHRARAAVR